METRPSATSFYVYDGMLLLDRAVSECTAIRTDCIAAYFKKLGEYEGISGLMRFQANGGIERPYGIKQIKDGDFIWITEKVDL